MPFFSVIIPNYNHATFLKERIETVLNQTYKDFEIILLDDASTDNSKEIIESFKSHHNISKIVYNSTNSGSPFIQWKKGIELAKGEWIWIAESDDFADTTFLEAAYKAIKAYPSLGIFYADAFIINHSSKNKFERFSEKKNNFFTTNKWNKNYYKKGITEVNENLKYACTINNASSTVFNKNHALPFLNNLTTYKYHGDWFLYLTLSLASNVYYRCAPLNSYREHNHSHLNFSGFNVRKKKEHFQILQLLYHHPLVTEKQKLINHFCAYFLSFGILKDGYKTASTIINTYLSIDTVLAIRVLKRLFTIKVLRKNYKGWFD